jgi:anti-sigma factor RsiW
MNAKSLEALLMDSALGQLSPEVEQLLSEHLASHPDAARVAEELSETMALATSLLRQPAPRLALPPPAAALFPPRRFRRVLALAASFVAGACVSFLTLRDMAPPLEKPLAVAPVSAPAPSVRRVEANAAVRTLPFWSKERAVALASSKTSTR